MAVDIPGFIDLVSQGLFNQAAELIRKTNCLPAVCGRVCPQEEQCQAVCTVAKSHKDQAMSVQIGKLERFVADWDREHPVDGDGDRAVKPTGRKVAIIGSGPGGLTAAGDIADAGHEVTIFEALHRTGGVLVYGIPEFRLRTSSVRVEVCQARRQYCLNVAIGNPVVDDLCQVSMPSSSRPAPAFHGSKHRARFMGVYSANEYLTQAS